MAVAAAPAATSDRRRNRPDFVLLGTVGALSIFGLVMIFSATRFALERSAIPATFSMERQMIFVTVGLLVLAAFSFIDYRDLRTFVPLIYGGTVLLLLVVFLFDPIKGARRWIVLGFFNLQPAEFAKITVILTTAWVLSSGTHDEVGWKAVLRSGGLAAVPAMLILLEPDLGTALVVPFVWFVMLFAAGLSWRRVGAVVGTGVVGVVAAVQVGLLRQHQLDRLRVFLDPTTDPQGIGYNLRQSKLAIGSGQILGKGLFQGTQTNLSYVPEQETDFIFTAVGEQLGFLGGVLVIVGFLIMVWRLPRYRSQRPGPVRGARRRRGRRHDHVPRVHQHRDDNGHRPGHRSPPPVPQPGGIVLHRHGDGGGNCQLGVAPTFTGAGGDVHRLRSTEDVDVVVVAPGSSVSPPPPVSTGFGPISGSRSSRRRRTSPPTRALTTPGCSTPACTTSRDHSKPGSAARESASSRTTPPRWG